MLIRSLQKKSWLPGPAPYYKAAGGLGLQTNLSAFWQFENTSWTDELATNNLTGTNAPTSVAGKVGNAVQFTQSASQFLSHASATALVLGGGTFSFQIWINLVSGLALGGNGSIMSKNDGGGGNLEYRVGTEFNGTANGFFWQFYDSGNVSYHCTSLTAISAGFHQIIGTWDGTTQSICIDNGTPDTIVPGGTPNAAGASTFMLGKDGGTATFVSAAQDVLVDQVGLWKGRVLSSGDRSLLYNGGAGLSYAAMV